MMREKKFIIGCEEWCALPELGIPLIKAKVDSGAKISSIHAFNIRKCTEANKEYIMFDIHPIQGNRAIIISCKAKFIGYKSIKSSNGAIEKRLTITTPIKIGEYVWNIEITLANRDSMGYRMLIGREAMKEKILVDPDNSFLLTKVDDGRINEIYSKKKLTVKNLNIILLASNPELYSNRRIIEAAEVRGHNIEFIDISHCYINVKANIPIIYDKNGRNLNYVDVLIPRLKPTMTFYGCVLIKQFESFGIFCLNTAVAIKNSRDKLRCLQILANKGINMPITAFAHSSCNSKHLIKMVGGAPVIIKLLEGTKGQGVVLAETQKAAESVISALKSVKANILVQEFIKEARGMDIRCIVINGKVVASIKRESKDDDFRANLHLGGVASAVKITKEEKRMAINVSKILGLQVAGVDIIRSNEGPKIIEVNSSPGLEGVEKTTGEDIAGAMIRCIENKVNWSNK